MKRPELAWMAATDLRDRLARGEFSAADLTDAFLARIAEEDPKLGAFAYLDPTLARKMAVALDAYRGTGRALGALHGLPVGVKDIIVTADLPTENGTPIDAGRRPSKDATVVQRLRAAGAVIIGKTVTTEFASFYPGKTRNPHNHDHTPGGSSSGSGRR
jgi:Asp-tRNA(Asn)/Glu-tRNA(Gln) amidotransferase A subunit family amidase